jgi:hypothetical protein
MRLLATFGIGIAGFVALFAGVFVVLPLVIQVMDEHGQVWGAATAAGALALCAVVALGLFKLHDRLSARYGPGGRAPSDRVYCQRCGEPAGLGDLVCRACGGNRFGVRRPSASGGLSR